MDIIATKHAVEYARKWAVDDEKGPLLLEFVTYRYGGHSYVFLFLFLFCGLFMLLLGCLIPALLTELVRRCNACEALKILSVVCRKTLKSGV